MPDPIPRRKLHHEVQDRLMAHIRSGAIAPGEQLPSERELMDTYGVGRPAVREALQALERAGIVEIAHGERARVVVPTAERLVAQISGGAMHLLQHQPGTLEHLKDARVFLETGTARLAAQRAGPGDVARLRDILARHREARDDAARFIDCDMAFHREIAAISGNPIYPAIVEAVFRWAGEHHRTMVRAPGAEALTLREHARIVEAIAAGDADAAAGAVEAHLKRANRLYARWVRGESEKARR